MNFLKRLFSTGKWECYYRKCGSQTIWNEVEIHDDWKKIKVPRRYWCADPFLVSESDKTYVFCELMDCKTSRGLLGAGIINKDGVDIKVIKDLGCHSSYPDVFKIDEYWYMIPETSERHSIELYRATDFPFEWSKVATLLDGVNVVDSTVFFIDKKPYVFIYAPSGLSNELRIGKLNLQQMTIDDERFVKKYSNKLGRPAGKCFVFNGMNCRPTQFGVNRYGEAIVLKKYSYNLETNEYEEEDVRTLKARDVLPGQIAKKINGIHTYNASNGYEIIDTHKKIFSLIRPLTLIFKKMGILGYRFNINE